MPVKKKITAKQLEKLIIKRIKIRDRESEYVDYLLDFQEKYTQAIAAGTTPPNGPKNPPGTSK